MTKSDTTSKKGKHIGYCSICGQLIGDFDIKDDGSIRCPDPTCRKVHKNAGELVKERNECKACKV